MRKFIMMVALCLTGMAAQAQQNLSWGQGPQVASPDVHADNSVTFNLIAPEAQKVQITAHSKGGISRQYLRCTWGGRPGEGRQWCVELHLCPPEARALYL